MAAAMAAMAMAAMAMGVYLSESIRFFYLSNVIHQQILNRFSPTAATLVAQGSLVAQIMITFGAIRRSFNTRRFRGKVPVRYTVRLQWLQLGQLGRLTVR